MENIKGGDIMINKKKYISPLAILLAVVMVIIYFPTTAFAVEEPPVLQSAVVTEDGHVELHFDKEMTVPEEGAAGFLVTGSEGINKHVTSAQLDNENPQKIRLNLTTTIKGGESPWLSYTSGAVASTDGGVLSNIGFFNITNNLAHPTMTITAPQNGTVGTAYTHTFSAIGGGEGYTFFLDFGTLPSGLNLNHSTGELSGTPLNTGSFTFGIKVIDENGAFDKQTFTINIQSPPVSVCTISGGGSHASLSDALAVVEDGQTITLLSDINHNQGIIIDGITVIFNLAGYTLNITNYSGAGLEVKNSGGLQLFDDSGEFNVTGTGYGVIVGGLSSATVTSISSSDTGAYVSGGGQLTVNGDVIANAIGVYANGAGSMITVTGSATGGTGGSGADAANGGSVFVGSIIVNGGNHSCGARVETGGNITIEGPITGSTYYLSVDNTIKTVGDKTIPTTKVGYHTYLSGTCTVWVKDTTPPSHVCVIGSTGYSTLDGAIAAVDNDETIKLLSSITDTDGMIINNKQFTLDLNGFTLDINNSEDIGLSVLSSDLLLTGSGSLNVSGRVFGVRVSGTSDVTVTNATSLGTYGDSYGAYVENGGKLTIKGNATGSERGAHATGTDSIINIEGNVIATCEGPDDSFAASVDSGGVINITGDAIGFDRGLYAQNPNSRIYVRNVSSTGDRFYGIQVENFAQVFITGNLSVNEARTGIFVSSRGEVTVDGTYSYVRLDGEYIKIYPDVIDDTHESLTEPSSKSGYNEYSTVNGKVWIKNQLQSDMISPTVSTILPPGTGTELSGSLVINFNETMDISAGTVALSGGGTVSGGIWSNGNKTYTVSYSVPAYNTRYVISISGFNDTAGNTMALDNTYSFTTKAETTTSGSSGSGRVRSNTDILPTQVYNADVIGRNDTNNTLPVLVDKEEGSAVVNLETIVSDVFTNEAITVIKVPKIDSVSAYTLELLASSLSGTQRQGEVTFSTEIGNITIPNNMLTGVVDTDGKDASITLGKGDISLLPEDIKKALGDRPLIKIMLTLDEELVEWNNPSVPVTLSIPYTPTPTELVDPEHIVIWYIDGNGNAVSVPNGRYDPETGLVSFATTHFSQYAVVWVSKTFSDLDDILWAKKPIEVMASKGIINGIGADHFLPSTNITRADYLVLLIKTLGLSADFDDNFDDVKFGNYYYEAIGIAKKLGIATGNENNQFNPAEIISRQDMMVLTARALEMSKGLKPTTDFKRLNIFTDKEDIDEYAVNSIALLVEEGLITGSGDKINSCSNTTRAEAAVFLYRLYNKY